MMGLFRFTAVVVGVLAWAAPAPAQILLGVEAGNRVIEWRQGDVVVKEERIPGAVVVKVLPGRVAQQYEIKEGDFIRGVVTEGLGKRRIDTISDLTWVMKNSTKNPTTIYLVRDNKLVQVGMLKVERVQNVAETSSGGPPRIRQVKVTVLEPKFTPAKESDLADAKPAK